MPNLPAALLDLATDLRIHRHFLRELQRAAGDPAFGHLPPQARERHQAFVRAHEEARDRLAPAGTFPEPTLVAALVDFLDRQGGPLEHHPTARHLNCLTRVLGRRRDIGL